MADLSPVCTALDVCPVSTDQSVIYGEDNRRDLYDPDNDPVRVELARSTVALISSDQIWINSQDPDKALITAETFGDRYELCEDEPFRDQPSAAFCSGSLVGPRMILTAGHCVEDQGACDRTSVVFGFAYETEGQDPTLVKSADIYTCHKILVTILADKPSESVDIALIELDRPVTGRPPLPVRREGKIDSNTPLYVLGHPVGLPTKIADGAVVRKNDESGFFVTNLDTYRGNSGSAVLNAVTNIIEGVLVRGEEDFEVRAIPDRADACSEVNECNPEIGVTEGEEPNSCEDTTRYCTQSKRCDDAGCRGEEVTRVTLVAPLIPPPTEANDHSADSPPLEASPSSVVSP